MRRLIIDRLAVEDEDEGGMMKSGGPFLESYEGGFEERGKEQGMNTRDNNTLYDTPHLLLFQAGLLGIGYGSERAVKGCFISFLLPLLTF